MFTFLAGPFLWFATAALIPLALHLFQRRKKVTVPFSTLRFLRMAQRKSTSRVRMENFLLWLLRTLLFLLLALAFALPVLRREGWGGLLGQSRRTVAVVWDVSFSMGYRSGSRDVWQEAQEAVASVVGGLRDGDQVCVFLAGEEVTALIERPSKDLAFVLNTVRAVRPSTGTSRLQPAMEAARRALRDSGASEKELLLVTDGQELPWTSFADAAGQPAPAGEAESDLRIFVALLGATQPDNAAPADVEIRPPLLLAGRPVSLRVHTANTGAARSLALDVKLDGASAGRQDITTGTAADSPAVFSLPSLGAGTHAGTISAPEDGLAVDDTLHFLLATAERLRVVVIATPEHAFFLQRALQPGAEATLFDVQVVPPNEAAGVDFAGAAAVLLNDALPLGGQALEKIEAYAQAGGTVAVFPGDGATPADYAAWSTLPCRVAAVRAFGGGEGRRNLRLVAARDPLFSTLRLPPGSVPSVAFRRAITPGEAQPGSEVLLTAGEDQPFLLRRKAGSGQVLLFTCSADRRWSDYPVTPVFLPVLHQLCLGGASGLNAAPFQRVGERVVFTDRSGRVAEGTEVRTPSGEIRRVRAADAGGASWALENATEPGIYTIDGGAEGPRPVLAVNVPREESNLTPLADEAVAAYLGRPGLAPARDKASLLHQIQEHRVGRPLAESLLWCALVVAALEAVWANRMSRTSAPLSASLHVDPSGRVKEAA